MSDPSHVNFNGMLPPRQRVNAPRCAIIPFMALFISFFLALFNGPPTDTPGGPIVQSIPAVPTTALVLDQVKVA